MPHSARLLAAQGSSAYFYEGTRVRATMAAAGDKAAAFSANTITQTAGTGDTQFDGLVTLEAAGGMDITTATGMTSTSGCGTTT